MSRSELKLVIWDLDETLVRGVFAEGDREVVDEARDLLEQLHELGIVQALATQNEPEVMDEALDHYGWRSLFQSARADFAPKDRKVEAILEELEISPEHTVFVDSDPFERDLMAVKVSGMRASSVTALAEQAAALDGTLTDEARRRPEMYAAMRRQKADESHAEDLDTFLAGCDIRVTVRPYEPSDRERALELLTRTNRMNLGTPMAPDAVVPRDGARATPSAASGNGAPAPPGGAADDHPRLVVAELRDKYGDSGRCGLVRLVPDGDDAALIESIAISCRARARGLSLALLVGMLRHPGGTFGRYRCRFHATGRNRPLRMLLWASGFTAQADSDELTVEGTALDAVDVPSWIAIEQRGDER